MTADDRSAGKLTPWRMVAGVLGVGLGAIVLTNTLSGWNPDAPHLGGSFDHAFVVLDGEHAVISLVGGDSPAWVVTLDARTGERMANGPVCPADTEGPVVVHQPVNDRVWVSCGMSDFLLLDLTTASPVLTRQDLAAQHAEIAAGVQVDRRSVSHDVDPPTRELKVHLHDGRTAWVGLDGSLSFSPTSSGAWRPGYYCWPEHTCSTQRRECLGFSFPPAGQGMALTSNRLHGEPDRPSEVISEWPARLLRPGFVKQLTTRCAFEHEDRYLVLHDSAAFEPKEALLSLASRDGTLHWTRAVPELGAAAGYEPRRARLVADEVLVLSTNERRRDHLTATWLDLATGEVHSAQQLFGRQP